MKLNFYIFIMTVNIPVFSNPFIRVFKSKCFDWHISPLPDFTVKLFPSLDDLLAKMLSAEASIFNTTGHLTTRTAFITDPYLKKFVSKIRGTGQIPLIALSFMLCVIVFGNETLRSEFELKYKAGTQMPSYVIFIYNNLRNYRFQLTYIKMVSRLSELVTKHFNLKDTILDVDYLIATNDAKDVAFSIITGIVFSGAYGLKCLPFAPNNIETDKSEVNSINTTFSEVTNELKIEVTPWSTMGIFNRMFDPTLCQGLLALFIGSYFSDNSKVLSFVSTQLTEFVLNVNSFNYFIILLQFLLLMPNGLCNPSSTRIPKPSRYSSEVSDEPTETANVFAFTPARTNELVTFCNNMYHLNRNWFYQFVRINRLYCKRFNAKKKK